MERLRDRTEKSARTTGTRGVLRGPRGPKKCEENMHGRDVIWWLAVVDGLWMVLVVDVG